MFWVSKELRTQESFQIIHTIYPVFHRELLNENILLIFFWELLLHYQREARELQSAEDPGCESPLHTDEEDQILHWNQRTPPLSPHLLMISAESPDRSQQRREVCQSSWCSGWEEHTQQGQTPGPGYKLGPCYHSTHLVHADTGNPIHHHSQTQWTRAEEITRLNQDIEICWHLH